MSKKIVALRPRSPKPLKGVSIRPHRMGPAELAQRDLEVHTEFMSDYLKGIRHLLEAWIDFEHGSTLFQGERDQALTLLGFAAVQLGEQLDAKVAAVRAFRQAPVRGGARA